MKSRDEILMILKMVQDGKITNEDAAKLIEAIEGPGGDEGGAAAGPDKKRKPGKTSFEEKMEEMAEGLENMVSDVVDSTQKAFRNFPEINLGNWLNTVEKRHFSYNAQEGMDLVISTKNGGVKMSPGEDKITVVFSIYTKKDVADPMENIVIEHDGNRLMIDATGVDGGAGIELGIPAIKYGKISINSKNGGVNCIPMKADDVELTTKNGGIKLRGVESPAIKVLTKNGGITCEKCLTEKAIMNTTNGSITISESECRLLDTNTTNGGIRCYQSSADMLEANTSNATIHAENVSPVGKNGIMNLRTSNGNVRITLQKDTGTMFKAHAGRHGKVIVNFPCAVSDGMEYAGRTENYDSAEKKMSITARTNLGKIEIE
ncbi:MAG: DUF4097 family beta strand repeat protein [Clostridia bacterium]|nr:DUF4097 family beta strand repeat protein [Clostridia bacterium]